MTDRLNVLLIGSGGREHALAYRLKTSPRLGALYVAPGNAGILTLAQKADISESDHDAVIAFCKDKAIDFVIVGPEAPLVDGLVDSLTCAGILTFGPTKEAAKLEGSKGYTKDLCAEFDIPTAAYARFGDCPSALAYLKDHPAPIVIKADGLAAGKGVTVAMSNAEAEAAIRECFDGAFGDAGAEVVIEAFLQGEPVCVMRWQNRTASGFGTGSQAGWRRRHRPEHRRHGRLQPGSGDDRCPHGRGHGEDCSPDHQRHGQSRRALHRHPVRRPDDHRQGAGADRI
jgi:phosphoribosylamine--glycine ligase